MSAITIQDLSAEKTLSGQALLCVAGGYNDLFRDIMRPYAMRRQLQSFSQWFPLQSAFAQPLALGVSNPRLQSAFVQQTAIAIGDNNQIVQNVTIVQSQTG